ncbi:hypothetical protein MITSMUL_04792 [Mitsuokella multacida DSM 20544]|uniref:Uncharacterized protein n=1 Tax=Mitsuokella multacida DSM 20544 TaxID=500635 RepID=C9KMY2_9FIRM|nr:hypothetical protein MITSMUL_04792 [Mitsuokella multacida DSM 20544]
MNSESFIFEPLLVYHTFLNSQRRFVDFFIFFANSLKYCAKEKQNTGTARTLLMS